MNSYHNAIEELPPLEVRLKKVKEQTAHLEDKEDPSILGLYRALRALDIECPYSRKECCSIFEDECKKSVLKCIFWGHMCEAKGLYGSQLDRFAERKRRGHNLRTLKEEAKEQAIANLFDEAQSDRALDEI